MRITVITGLSGSGKTTAIHAYEDRGHFCVDNLPVSMIPSFVETVRHANAAFEHIVLCIDAREREFLAGYEQVASAMRADGHDIEVLYLEARDDALIRRFSQTRRRHPLAEGDIVAALAEEKAMLTLLRQQATHIVDTSDITIHDLKQLLYSFLDDGPAPHVLTITLLSFGYKYGVPLDADLVFDVRFLSNPYFVPALKPKTGLDADVYAYVYDTEEGRAFLDKLQDFVEFLVPRFEREGKSYLTLAIGCTGGQHRSVATVAALEGFIRAHMPGFRLFTRHRDMGRE